MARKGVLASNQDVTNMTDFQWYWEYLALRNREQEQIETVAEVARLIKRSLVKILGLDLLLDDKEGDNFIPLSLLVGRREVAEKILKKISESEALEQATTDQDFEALSGAIARGEDLGDMDPIMISSDPAVESKFNDENYLNKLRALGVKITNNSTPIKVKFDDDGD